MATSGTRQASVRTEEFEEMGIDAATHDNLVESAPQILGSSHGACPVKSLPLQATEVDNGQPDQLPLVPVKTPGASEEGACAYTLA